MTEFKARFLFVAKKQLKIILSSHWLSTTCIPKHSNFGTQFAIFL